MAQKQAIEDARFVLPNACDTKMIVTFNARSLMNFFTLRCCRRAQWEIQDVAIQMLRLVKQAALTFICQSRSQLCERRLLGRKNDLRRNHRSTCVFP